MFQKAKEMLPGDHKLPELEYSMKYRDLHRERWDTGDWTDDSDQMILILLSLVANKGKVRGMHLITGISFVATAYFHGYK